VHRPIDPAARLSQILSAREAVKGGRFELAANLARQILADDPDDIEGLEISALAAGGLGDDVAAEDILRRAISAGSGRRWPYADLIRLLLKLGRAGEAGEVARAALTADAKNADAHAMLGFIMARDERWFDAAEALERAVALAGAHPQLLTGLGHALLRLGRLEAARAPLEAAVRADPNGLQQLAYLAELEERLGRFEEASVQLARAERIAKASGTDVDLQRSVLLARMGKSDEALALLDQREELPGGALLQRGRLRERVGRYQEAWNDWTRGKDLLADASARQYAADEIRAEAQALLAFFTPPQITATTPAAPRNEFPQPIFILGFPRSGTTLTEQILASHSAIRAGGELPFGAELRELAISLAGGIEAFPRGLARQEDWPTTLRDLYLARSERYGLLAPGAAFFTDKMPSNDFWLPLLRLAFPKSPVVLVRRHPLDVLTSVMAHDMTHGFNCAYRLEDAARHMALVDELMGTYRANGIGPTHETRYEALIADQVGETGRLMSALGLAMEPAQLRFHDRREVSPTPSYAQVSKPLNAGSIGRWRHFAEELRPVRPLLAGTMKAGSYTD
jgi:tetratricopeptide (TPR) repeat protein